MWRHTLRSAAKTASPEETVCTFLGRGVRMQGRVRLAGTTRIDGHFEGEILAEGTLILGEQAFVKGTITARTLIGAGKVEGSVTATHRVQLLKPAVFHGDIHTSRFSIEEGALFHGRCDMASSPTPFSALENAHPRSQISIHDNLVPATIEAPMSHLAE